MTKRFAVASSSAVVGILFATGAGLRATGVGQEPHSTQTSMSEQSSIWANSAGNSVPLPLAKLRVFFRPPTSSDQLPAQERSRIEALYPPYAPIPTEYNPGAFAFDHARLVVGPQPPAMLSVYAVPTMRGWVCYAVSGDVGAGCVSTLTDGISIALSRGRDPSAVAARGFEGALRTLVFGLASDDVRAVTLVDDAGTEYAPEMGENAYLMELPPDVNLVEVRIQYNDAPPSTVRLSP